MKRHFLSKRETREFQELIERFGVTTNSKSLEIEENDHSIIYDNGKPILIKFEGTWLPTMSLMVSNNFPRVTVDEGALRGIRNGANLYSAGIKEIKGNIVKGSTCVIEDPNEIPVGSAIVSSEVSDIISRKKGSYLKVYELR
ncbi:MAG: DUF1947 domain-containing protein [Thermoplasmatales archaeon]